MTLQTMDSTYLQNEALKWIGNANRILISAGAGLSAAAGYDYDDEDRFADLFPGLHKQGFTSRKQFVSPELSDEILWGYWAIHTADIRFGQAPSPIYRALRALIGNRDYFVMTSNVDMLFARNKFRSERIYAPQGDYGTLQCFSPCTNQVWNCEAILKRLRPNVDLNTGMIPTELVPKCPSCGGRTFLNINMGKNFVPDYFMPAANRLGEWISVFDEPLLVLEIGVGYSTPSVIRWPAENITALHPDARLIRVNPIDTEVPAEIADISLSVPVTAARFLGGKS